MWRKCVGLATTVMLCAVLVVTMTHSAADASSDVPVQNDLNVVWGGGNSARNININFR